ncbi:hypothetical protein AALA17_07635 [Lactobacillaceae bacterium 24-114]
MKRIIFIAVAVIILGMAGGLFFYQHQESSTQDSTRQSKNPQTVTLNDQQIGILAGLAVDPDWVKQQINDNNLVYGIVKPSDTVPDEITTKYSFLVTDNDADGTSIYYQVVGDQLFIKYTRQYNSKLITKEVNIKQLTQQFYQTSTQKQQVDDYVSQLRTE